MVVDTNTDAVVVEADAQATTLGSGGSGGGSDCRLEPVGTIGEIFVDSFEEQWSNPDLFPFLLWCGDEMRGLVWLDMSGGDPAPALDPETIAMHIRDEIPVPNAEIRINPDRGLVGVDSWFWIEGYDGSPIEDSTDAFGQRVEVEARVTSYEWSFGDGDTLVAKTPGRSYPHRSEIRHVYRAFVRGACLRLPGRGHLHLRRPVSRRRRRVDRAPGHQPSCRDLVPRARVSGGDPAMKRALARLGLLGLLVGTPIALGSLVGSPMIPNFQGSDGLSGSFVPVETVLRLLGLLSWALWAYLAFAVLLHAAAIVAASRDAPGQRVLLAASSILTPKVVRSLVEFAIGSALVATSVSVHASSALPAVRPPASRRGRSQPVPASRCSTMRN